MILSSFRLADYYNWQGLYSGLDSPLRAQQLGHYPHIVEYNFNSRGFRDREWPCTIAKDTIWCFGDSFTVGLGSPIEHTWHWQLEQLSGKPAITVAMDGASNDWIAKKIHQCQEEIGPMSIVVQWSYLHRREVDLNHSMVVKELNKAWINFYSKVKKDSWPSADTWDQTKTLPKHIVEAIANHYITRQSHFMVDNGELAVRWEVCDNWRRWWYGNTHHLQDMAHFLKIIAGLQQYSNIVHTFIPKFCGEPEELRIYKELDQLKVNYIPVVPIIDYARDGHHYDILTAKEVAKQVLTRLS